VHGKLGRTCSACKAPNSKKRNRGRSSSNDDDESSGDGELTDPTGKPYECDFGCGFDGVTGEEVEKHEQTCAKRPTSCRLTNNACKKPPCKKRNRGRSSSNDNDESSDDGELTDPTGKPYECEFGCGFDGVTGEEVEKHEQTCAKRPAPEDRAYMAECYICHEPLSIGRCIALHGCGHVMHADCRARLERMGHSTCPLSERCARASIAHFVATPPTSPTGEVVRVSAK
jgi:hypothetical protein